MHKIKNPKEKLAFLFGVILYCLVLSYLDMYCVIRTVFHISCPGCGMTRAVCSVLTFNFTKAFEYHPLVFITPLMLLYFLFDGHFFGKYVDRVILILIAVSFILVWVLRLTGVIYSP